MFVYFIYAIQLVNKVVCVLRLQQLLRGLAQFQPLVFMPRTEPKIPIILLCFFQCIYCFLCLCVSVCFLQYFVQPLAITYVYSSLCGLRFASGLT